MDVLSLRNAIPDRIETARLILRAPDLRDVDAIAALANNPAIHAMTSSIPYPYSRADAVAFVTEFARRDSEKTFSILLSNGTLIGSVGLKLKKEAPPELGYWIGQPFWGHGYASEATHALVAAAIATGRCSRLVARARAENAASRAVLEKLGFALDSETIADCGPHKGTAIAHYALGQERVPHAQSA